MDPSSRNRLQRAEKGNTAPSPGLLPGGAGAGEVSYPGFDIPGAPEIPDWVDFSRVDPPLPAQEEEEDNEGADQPSQRTLASCYEVLAPGPSDERATSSQNRKPATDLTPKQV